METSAKPCPSWTLRAWGPTSSSPTGQAALVTCTANGTRGRVAIRVVAAEVASDPNPLPRFEREAPALAALNIMTVYGVGTHEGVPHVVTELIKLDVHGTCRI